MYLFFLFTDSSSIRCVKCDQARPVCQRCVRAKRPCDGYEDDTHDSTTQENRLQVILAASEIVPMELDVQPYPAGVTYSAESISLFQYFRTDVASEFAGAFDQNFWTVGILQATNLQPAVWYAASAIAAIYRSYKLIGDSRHRSKSGKLDPSSAVALKHYNASLKCIVDIFQQPRLTMVDKEVLLVTTMLFAILCRLRADLREAYSHLLNGLQLMEQWDLCEDTSAAAGQGGGLLSMESLRVTFLRMYYQTASMREWHRPRFESLTFTNGIVPVPFMTATDAFNELEIIWNATRSNRRYIVNALRGIPARPQDSMSGVWAAYRIWKTKYQNFRKAARSHTASEVSLLILDIRTEMMDVMSQADYADIMSWDNYEASYKQILDLSQRVCEMDDTYKDGDPRLVKNRKRQFAVTPSVCEPLYDVAHWSRDPKTRRRALDLLSLRRIDECMFGPEFMVWLGKNGVLFEERAWRDPKLAKDTLGCECVPESVVCQLHRLADEEIIFFDEIYFEHRLKTVIDLQLGLPGTILSNSTKQIT